MFSIIRLSIGFLVFAIVLGLCLKFKKKHKRFFINLTFFLTIVFTSTLFLLPFENAFLEFDSIESSCRYINFPVDKSTVIIEGRNADFVVTETKDIHKYIIVPKNSTGWKVATGNNTILVDKKIIDGSVVHLYKYAKSKDYFIVVLDTQGLELKISDSCNSEFAKIVNGNKVTNQEYKTYYSHIYSLDDSYYLKINDNIVFFKTVTQSD